MNALVLVLACVERPLHIVPEEHPPEDTAMDSEAPVDSEAPPDSDEPVLEPPPTIAAEASLEVDVDGASIWNGLVRYGEQPLFTTMNAEGLVVASLDPMGLELDEFRVLSPSELPDGNAVTDHAVAVHGDQLVALISDHDARQLWALRASLVGDEVSTPELLYEGPLETNDMNLAVHQGLAWAVWGEREKRQLIALDQELEVQRSVELELESPQSNLGATRSLGEELLMVGGNLNNRALQRTVLDLDAKLQESELVLGDPEDEQWNWFSSGLVQDERSGCWIVAYTEMTHGESADSVTRIWLALFDPEWALLETWPVTEKEGWTRPHLLLHEDQLLLSYDKPGHVRIARFELSR